MAKEKHIKAMEQWSIVGIVRDGKTFETISGLVEGGFVIGQIKSKKENIITLEDGTEYLVGEKM